METQPHAGMRCLPTTHVLTQIHSEVGTVSPTTRPRHDVTWDREDGIQPQEEAHFAMVPFWVIRKAFASRHAAHAVLHLRRDGEGHFSTCKCGSTSRGSQCVSSVTLV